MKILLANSFLHVTGGADRVFLDEAALLERNGHEVVLFGMQSPHNPPSRFACYHVSEINFGAVLASGTIQERLRAAGRVLYSAEAFTRLAELLRDEKPDLVHLHNVQNHLSLSILRAARRAGVPVVWTLHDYELVCPNTHLLRQGRICEDCAGRHFYMALVNKCKKDNLFASALAAASVYFQHYILRVIENVSVFIGPSHFLKRKLVEMGIPESRIACLSNPVELPSLMSRTNEDPYCVYVGRLSPEKAVDVLVRAAAQTRIPLRVVGDGSTRSDLERLAQDLSADNVKFMGHLRPVEVARQLRGARFSVLPSIWYENFPMTIVESFAVETPVIASRLGGCSDLVNDAEDGYLFTPGDYLELADRMSALWQEPRAAAAMGEKGRRKISELCNPHTHYLGLMRIYRHVLEGQ